MIRLKIEHFCDYCGAPAEEEQVTELQSHWHPEYIIPSGGKMVGRGCACNACFVVAMTAVRDHRLATAKNLN
jgi:hypothetical protein